MHASVFGNRAHQMPMMQASNFSSSQDRGLIALIRAMLPLPEVLPATTTATTGT